LASRANRRVTSPLALTSTIGALSANRWPAGSSTSNTPAMPPRPSDRITRYWPIRVLGSIARPLTQSPTLA
jgi:hypothetical protein